MTEAQLLAIDRPPLKRRPRPDRWTPYRRGLVYGALVGVGTSAFMCALELLGCGGGPVNFIMLLVAITIVLLLPISVIALLSRARRPVAISTALACVTAVPSFLVSYPARHIVRAFAFGRLADRSEPLVAAIHAYEQLHSAPPPHLEALVPEFLPEVPGTGMPSYPEYTYWVSEPMHGDPSRWTLKVECSLGMLNWDEFYYSPSKNGFDYSDEPVTRHGEWIYVHE